MEGNYKTVKHPGSDQIIEKRSRFIADVVPVTTEAEALAHLDSVRKAHPMANHHVYAYILRENNLMRYSDDGEPSSTAGIPTLDVLRKQGLTDVCAVVTRYFGGTLLGTGGLVRAYSGACKAGVLAAEPIEKQLCDRVALEASYALAGKIEYIINQEGHTIEKIDYGVQVEMSLLCEAPKTEAFIKKIIDATGALCVPRKAGTAFMDKPISLKEED